MAIDTARIGRIKAIAAKLETTTGTAESLTATEADFRVYDPQLTENIGIVPREMQTALGNEAAIASTKTGTVTFYMYAHGKGSAGVPEWASTFLQACGFDDTVTAGTYIATNNGKTATIAVYEDGVKRTLVGAAGTFTVTGTAGNPLRFDFTFTGKLGAEEAEAMPSPTYPTVIPPLWTGGVTFGSYTPKLSTLTIDAGNGVILREHAGDATGYFAASITSRNSTGSCDPESVSGRNWRTQIDAGTEEAMSMVCGGTANNIITIASAKVQPIRRARGNRNDLMTDQVDLQFNGSSPFTIAFT